MEKKKAISKQKNIDKKFSAIKLAVFLLFIAILITLSFCFKTPIEKLINANFSADYSQIDQNGLSVYFIDVGQGDSIAIRFPDGKTMLVDAGPSSSKEVLTNYLKNNFFKSEEKIFDYVLLTHSDADHCGGMTEICNDFVINKIYRPQIYSKYENEKYSISFDETNGDSSNKNICDSATYYYTIKAFKNEISESGENAQVVFTDIETANTTQKISGENYWIDFFAPTQNYITKSAGTVINDFSPIMVLNFNGKKIMLTGDASITSETLAMEKTELPDVDLLKVGHHGSSTSTGIDFLEKIKPEFAVISVGSGNSYGHPKADTLNRLLSVGSTVYRTDENGNIIANVATNESKLIVVFDKSSSIYIHIEYLLAGIIIISVYFCFGVKLKK